MTILEEAGRIVSEDRIKTYGHPLDNWTLTANLMSAYLGIDITAEEAATLMILVKIAREKYRHKTDNQIDTAGYAKVIEDIHEERNRREQQRSRRVCEETDVKLYGAV